MPVEIQWKPHKTAVIKGIHTLDVIDDRRFCLLSDQGKWIVYGCELVLKQFDSEKKLVWIEGQIHGIYDSEEAMDQEPKEMRFWERWFG